MDIRNSLKLYLDMLRRGHKGELTSAEADELIKKHPMFKVFFAIIVVVGVFITLVICFLYARYVAHLY